MNTCSLFSGIGGIDLAFEKSGFRTVWANEIDKDACDTYRTNFPNNNLIEGDIKRIDKTTIPYHDVLIAGFPCQPFSICGKKKGFQDERGNLFFQIVDVIDATKPQVVFLENVANLINHDSGKTFNIIHNELASNDYYIKYLVADACNYGIPQHRTRTYIVAFRDIDKCNKFTFPPTTKLKVRIFDIIDKSKKQSDFFYLKEDTYQYNKMIRFIKDDNQIYRFSDYGIQSSKNGISFTLKANMGTWYDRVPIIKDNYGIRTITPNECLALMGFPDNFSFSDKITMKSAYKQCGNSVIVPLIVQIANEIKKAIE